MKIKSKQRHHRFQLQMLGYGNCYYIDRVAELESALRKKPRSLQIEMVGVGEILADAALRIRSVLLARSPKTQIVTNARSSLQGGSVLVWLLGDRRIIRDDARIFFRRANLSEPEEPETSKLWKDEEPNIWDSSSEIEPEEGDYARVLQLIDEFLPVKELAGRLVEVPVLRQFGLVENKKVDQFLATAFRRESEAVENKPPDTARKRVPNKVAVSRIRQK
jgi:hypothetical protein